MRGLHALCAFNRSAAADAATPPCHNLRNKPMHHHPTQRSHGRPQWTAIALLASTLLATGCGTTTVSEGVAADGTATRLVWPDPARDAWLPAGTFPNAANLSQVAAGMSKDQLYDLLGRPHFSEGIGRVREWDYVFNVRRDGGVSACQYKVIFDHQVLARSFHWKAPGCEPRA